MLSRSYFTNFFISKPTWWRQAKVPTAAGDVGTLTMLVGSQQTQRAEEADEDGDEQDERQEQEDDGDAD